jgi:hypothetical protein
MAELAAILEDGTVVEKLPSPRPLSASPAPAPDDNPGAKSGPRRNRMITAPISEAQAAAGPVLPPSNRRDGCGLEDERLQQLDEVTLAAAKSAKDYRSFMLENLKVQIAAAPDRTNGHASGFGKSGAAQSGQPQQDGAKRKPQRQPPTLGDAAEVYRTKAFELINANVNAVLDYAQRLAAVRSPAEFIELSTNHACRHFELVMKHAAALAALSRSLPPNRPGKE